MICFYNDHLVPPVPCQIVYKTVPEELHIPIVFLQRRLTSDGEPALLGGLFPEPNRVEVYLDTIFNCALAGERVTIGVPAFRLWYQLLHTTYHEFGHLSDQDSWDAPEGAYEAGGREMRYEEGRADEFATASIAHLAELDQGLFQPRWLGYLSIQLDQRIVQASRLGQYNNMTPQSLKHMRYVKCGGHLTACDVAEYFYPTGVRQVRESEATVLKPTSALVRRVAGDLAYKYRDSAGRQHLLFDFGQLPVIARRLREGRTHWTPVKSPAIAQSPLPSMLAGSRKSKRPPCSKRKRDSIRALLRAGE